MRMLEYPPFAKADLELRMEEALDRQGFSESVKRGVRAFLAPLREKHEITCAHYWHSLRVGLLSESIAEVAGINPKPCLLAGLLHDVGKALIPLEVLGKQQGWTEQDHDTIKRHVRYGYDLLRGRFNFSADVMARHHTHQPNGYPKRLPPLLMGYSKTTQVTVARCGRILALADTYDALHRVNNTDKGGGVRTGEEIRETMLKQNLDQLELVVELYSRGVFTTQIA